MRPAEPMSATPGPELRFRESTVEASKVADPFLADILSVGSRGFESLRALRAKLKAFREPNACLGLVSATPGEGTSTIALGLAAAHAQADPHGRILLLEARLRAPALEGKLGLPTEPGLADWLAAPGEGAPAVRRVRPWGFHLLSAGMPPERPEELLGGDAVSRLVARARESFDLVLVDCPPLEKVADAVVLQDLFDGFLVVVRERYASRDRIRKALSTLKPELVRGAVFNDRTEILSRWIDRRSGRAKH